jgi:hypothetical protein
MTEDILVFLINVAETVEVIFFFDLITFFKGDLEEDTSVVVFEDCDGEEGEVKDEDNVLDSTVLLVCD